MLKPPPIKNESIISYIYNTYGLQAESLVFIPIGADLNTSVFKAGCTDGNQYFVKLRLGAWNKASVTIPNYLAQTGLQHVIPTIKTRQGKSWGKLKDYNVKIDKSNKILKINHANKIPQLCVVPCRYSSLEYSNRR